MPRVAKNLVLFKIGWVACVFSDGLTALLTIGVGWAALLPVLVKFSARFDAHAVEQLQGA